MPAPTTSVLDNFNRANENPLSQGGNWDAVSGTQANPIQVAANQAKGTSTTTCEQTYGASGDHADTEASLTITSISDLLDDFAAALGSEWESATLPGMSASGGVCKGTSSTTSMERYHVSQSGDCSAQLTVTALPGTGNGMGPCICLATSGPTNNQGYYAFAEPTRVTLNKMTTGGGVTQLGTSAIALGVGDQVKVRRSGNSVIASYKPAAGAWSDVIMVTDTDYTSGFPGMRIRGTAGSVDDFTASDINFVGTLVRHSAAGGAATGITGYIAYALTNYVVLALQTNVSGNRSTSELGRTSVAVAVGDQLAVQAIGSSINVWYKPSGGSWTLLFSVTDTTYTTGKVGAVTRGKFRTFDDFGGGVPAGEIDVPFISSETVGFATSLVKELRS